MKYIDTITLKLENNKYKVDQINFRESLVQSYDELFDVGYVDVRQEAYFNHKKGCLRFSKYLEPEKVSNIICRLMNFYEVGYTNAEYSTQEHLFYLYNLNEKAIIRIFPLEDYKKIDPDVKLDTYKIGVIYIPDTTQSFKPSLENDIVFKGIGKNKTSYYTRY